ncbi:MAG: class I tRNA ligase family protein, partial [Comamonas sp.]
HLIKNEDGTPQVPFKTVYVHGLVRDGQGQKMSKSKGNVLDPLDIVDGITLDALLEKRTSGMMQPKLAEKIAKQTKAEFPEGIASYGTDALRFTFCSLASTGRDIKFDMGRVEGYRNFCNKIWNASRFVLMNCEGYDCGLKEHSKEQCQPGGEFAGYMHFSQSDRWIASQLQKVEAEVAKGFAEYRLDNVANAIYDFVWNEFCDWYLEIAKVQIQTGNEAQQRATRRTLIRTLEAILRLAHPIIPFVTEELWQQVAPVAGLKGDSIAVARYPEAQPAKIDEAAIAYVGRIKQMVDACRALRGEMGVSPAQRLPLLTVASSEADSQFLRDNAAVLQNLAKLSEVKVFDDEATWTAEAQNAPVSVVGDARLALFVEVDVAAEKIRLGKEATRLEAEIASSNKKLGNEAFVAKAPAAVLEQERTRVSEKSATLARIKEQIARLG